MKPDDTTLPACPVCEGNEVPVFLRRATVPIHQNLLVDDVESARRLNHGELQLRSCHRCGFVFNTAFDLSLLNYSAAYENTQVHSGVFDGYVGGLVEQLLTKHNVRDCRIVEVGCGKGDFLKRLVADESTGNTGYGFDPTYLGPDTLFDGRLHFEKRFYDESCADVPADVVVCRHVIEHVPDPVAMLSEVRRALSHSPRARVFFETPCVEWILRNRVAWDFFYEHCSIFTADSLSTAFERAGFEVESVDHVFGGQYLWLCARPTDSAVTPRHQAGAILELAAKFTTYERACVREWQRRIAELSAAGPTVLWGAGAKGVTFANLADGDRSHLSYVVDVNPHKQGHFLPGTGHPIVSPEHLADCPIVTAVVLNPNYTDEIQRTLDTLCVPGRVVDLMSSLRAA